MSNEIDLSSEANQLPRIKFRDYDNAIREFDPQKILPFNTEDIPFETQATTYYTIAQLTEQANFNWKNAKVQLDTARSTLYTYYVQELTNEGKRPTENNINAHIMQDSKFVEASNLVNTMERNYRILLRFTSAMEQRKDMMQSMSATKRAEMNSGQNTSAIHNQTGELYQGNTGNQVNNNQNQFNQNLANQGYNPTSIPNFNQQY